MANTTTTLAGALAAKDLAFTATAATGATVGGLAKIDDEFMWIVSINGTVMDVRGRGSYGTQVVAHPILAPVLFCLASDVPTPSAGHGVGLNQAARNVVSAGASGAVALPVRDTVVIITLGSAAALTLADPAGVPDGTFITFVSTTAYAHTVTLTTGTLGSGASDVFTFVNTIGGSKTLMAYKGLWADIATSLTATETAGVAVA